MGLSGSKDTENEFCTPPKIGTHRRIIDLEYDPRSPSTGITRTPIIVDKTPEGLLDPRSPTVGITRTPITHVTGVGKTDVTVTNDLAPLMLHDEEDINKLLADDMEDTDRLLKELEDMPKIDALEISDLIDKKRTTSLSSSVSKKEAKTKVYEDVPQKVTRVPTKAPQPKQLFPSKHLTPANKDSTRSPLSTRTIDMNSPRVIVQKKQSKNLETKKTKSCSLEAVTMSNMADKENLNL